jgi:hypothetical protein
MRPGDEFPAGTLRSSTEPLAGTIVFVALTAVLFVLGRHLARRGERGWAARTAAGW